LYHSYTANFLRASAPYTYSKTWSVSAVFFPSLHVNLMLHLTSNWDIPPDTPDIPSLNSASPQTEPRDYVANCHDGAQACQVPHPEAGMLYLIPFTHNGTILGTSSYYTIKKLSAKIHFIYFSIKKMYYIFKTYCIICLIFSKCCLCRNFNFFCSNNTFFINHAQNSEYQSRHLKD
jgi:hypothetical protein